MNYEQRRPHEQEDQGQQAAFPKAPCRLYKGEGLVSMGKRSKHAG